MASPFGLRLGRKFIQERLQHVLGDVALELFYGSEGLGTKRTTRDHDPGVIQMK